MYSSVYILLLLKQTTKDIMLAVNVIYLDFSKSFNKVLHDMEQLDRTTGRWICCYLQNCTQIVLINGSF